MTPRDFAYWLQGFFEVADTDDVKPEQIRMIKEHLSLVLTKVTPTMEELKEEPKVDYPPFRISQDPFEGNRLICSAVADVKSTTGLPTEWVAAFPWVKTDSGGNVVSNMQPSSPIGKYAVDTGIKCQLTC